MCARACVDMAQWWFLTWWCTVLRALSCCPRCCGGGECEEDLYSHTVNCCDASTQTENRSQTVAQHGSVESTARSTFNFLCSYHNSRALNRRQREILQVEGAFQQQQQQHNTHQDGKISAIALSHQPARCCRRAGPVTSKQQRTATL